MKNTKRKKTSVDLPSEDARMSTVDVARFVGISYQTAYNRVLAGVYGLSEYNPKTRRMTVSALHVHRVVQRARKQAKIV